MKNSLLDKQTFIDGMRCTKKMFLGLHNPELEELSPSIISAEEISDFKRTVRNLIAPGGFSCEGLTPKMKKIKQGHQVFYDFPVNDGSSISTVDVLIHKHPYVEIITIVPATELYDDHYYESAFTSNCLLNAGFKLNGVFISHVNKQYIRNGSITSSFVNLINATRPILRLVPRIKKKIEYFIQVCRYGSAPDREVGYYCFKPHPCSFKNTCWKNIPANSVFDIKSMRTTRKLGYYYRDIKSIDDLTKRNVNNINEKQMIQITSLRENKIAMNYDALQKWFNEVQQSSEICFLDFETISPIVPPFEGSHSFKKIAFQFSLHEYNHETENLKHYEYLAKSDKGIDCRKEFLKNLITAFSKCHSHSKIIVFNDSFEKSVLNELRKEFPEYDGSIRGIINRIVDMMEIFRQDWYYDPRFKASWKLKTVAAVFWTESPYEHLNIKDGVTAANCFRRLLTAENGEAEQIRKSLLEYCQTDTYSMVMIFQRLKKIIASENQLISS